MGTGHEVQPHYIPLRRLGSEEDEQANREFVGEIIDRGNLASIVGMSGGPIFGFFERDGQHFYDLIAIQSDWDRNNRAYGCLLKAFVDHVWAEGQRRRDAGA